VDDSTDFEKLTFPTDGKVVWIRHDGKVLYKDGVYYGLYYNGLIKGVYESHTNNVINLIRDPSRYFNICVGVIDYLFAKTLLKENIFRVHAACVVKDDRGLLIGGAKSTGKTTLLMKFLRNNYKFISDDISYIQLQNHQLFCIPFPRTIKINLEDISRFPSLYADIKFTKILTSDGRERAILKLNDNSISYVSSNTHIYEILIPSFSDKPHCSLREVQPSRVTMSYCITDLLKEKFSFDLLFPIISGHDLLTIDYLKDPHLIVQQKELCERILHLYRLKFFEIGQDFEELNLAAIYP